MLRFNSLKTRVVVLTTVPLSLLLLVFLTLTLRTAQSAVDNSVRRSLRDAGSVFIKLLAIRRNELVSMARVTVRDPRFFATFSIPDEERGPEFGPTLQGVAEDFLGITDADFLEIVSADGSLLASASKDSSPAASALVQAPTAVRLALQSGIPVTDFYRQKELLVVAAVVPIYVANQLEGVLRFGSYCDLRFLREVRRLTGAEVCVIAGGDELASTFPASTNDRETDSWPLQNSVIPAAPEAFALSEAFATIRDGTQQLAVQVRIEGTGGALFDVFLSRELGSDHAPIVRVTEQIAFVGLASILVTLLAAYLVARRITHPISAVVDAAAALQSGNYEYPLHPTGADEVAFLGRSFVRMREAMRTHVEHLRSVDQMKSNFIALAGHELKTPLTVISSFNEMIVAGEMGTVSKEAMEATQLMQEKLSDLNRLVENILDMSRAEHGMLDLLLEERDLNQVVRNVVEKRDAAVTRRVVTMTVGVSSEPIIAQVDARRIEHALLNLVDNALRFTPDGGSIRVEVEREGENGLISVQDTGIGIASADQHRIFEKAFQPDDVMHHSSGRFAFGSRGFGLGLALCRAIVDAHGGEVLVHSRPGSGSRFAIILPLEAMVATPASTGTEGALAAR